MSFKLNLNTVPSNNRESLDLKQFEKQVVPIEDLLVWCSTNQCSDLYIKEYSHPYISRFGQIVKIPCVPTTRDEWMNFYDLYIKEELNAKYVRQKMLDTSTEVRIPEDNPYYGKFDTNFFRYRTSLGFSENYRIATFRMIRPEDPTFDTIAYPEECKVALKKAYNEKTGIIFFTGPTGSGKALHIETPIKTITGYKLLRDIEIGDIIYDENNVTTRVIDKYCPNSKRFYKILIHDNNGRPEIIKAADNHLWKVNIDGNVNIVDTETLYKVQDDINPNIIIHRIDTDFEIIDIAPIIDIAENYYCLAVDSPTHMFLCGEIDIPTHNTTTLAAVMNTFTRPGEILDNKVFISLEDPIEYTFHSTDSVKFSQKELDKDFISFASGIKQALREHPNCVNVGEARDREVISAAIEAARTGHLVSTSFHAGDVGGTVSRLLFHLDNNKDLAYDLILNLNIIMSQKLLKREDRYEVDTQFLLFVNEIREHLLHIVNEELNIQFEINKLIKDERLQKLGLVKDWSYEN